MLPHEDDARRDIQAAFPTELAECRDLIRLALEMVGCTERGEFDIPATPIPGVTNCARSLSLGLYAKACKGFRSILLLGEAGYGESVADGAVNNGGPIA